MAIQWGGWSGHLRLGIDVFNDPINSSSTATNVYVETYVQCDSSFNFNDAQTVSVGGTGTSGATYNFNNTLQANQSVRLGTITISNQVLNPNGGPTYSFTAQLSGAFNGASPSATAGYILPAKPPAPNSPPNKPVQTSPAWDAVIDAYNQGVRFYWNYYDPDGNPQIDKVLRLRNPAGTWYRWNGSSLVVDDNVSTAGGVGTEWDVWIPPGVIPNSGLWLWSVFVGDSTGMWSQESQWNQIYFSTPPTVTVTEPTTTATSGRPAVKWVYADADGTPQYGYDAKIVESSVYSASGYDPLTNTSAVWQKSATGTATQAAVNVDLPNHKTLRAYVMVSSSPNPAGGLQHSTYAYKQFTVHVAPYAPAIKTPQNGAIVDLAAGFTMSWNNTFYVGTGGLASSQAAFAVRRKQGTGAFEWWNGATWQSTEYFLAGTSAAYTFRAGEVANNVAWTFSTAIRDGYGGQSPYSSGVTITGSTAAQVTVIEPIDVVTITNPIIQWSMFDVENDPQQTYQVRIVEKSAYGADPLIAAAVWDSGEITSATTRSTEVPVDLANGNEYRAYVRIKTTGVYSGWSYSQFIISLQPPAQPALTVTVLDDRGAVQIDIQGRDSMLTSDASRSYAGWEAATNATVVGTQALFTVAQSDYAMRFKSVAAGDFSIRTADNSVVAANTSYTAAAQVVNVSGSTARSYHVDIRWLDSALAVVGTTTGSTVTEASGLPSTAVGSPPSTAAYARVVVVIVGATAANETHDLYDPVIRPGAGSEWSPGGLLGTTSVAIVAQNPYRIVRRGLNIPMPIDTQMMTILDEEIPIGVPQVYGGITRAVYPNAILASSTILTDAVTWTSGWLWLSDPLRPGSARAWGPQSFGSTIRPTRQGKFRPIARPDAVLTTGVRALREGVFTIVTATKAEREAFNQFDDRSESVLIRIPPDQGETEGETIYAKFEGDAPHDRPLPHRTPHRTIEQKWVEQRRPITQLEYSDVLELTDVGLQVFVGLDSDGVPYIDTNTPAEQSTVALARDSDNAVYFQSF